MPTTASSWHHLYESGSFFNITGFSRESFEEMHDYLYDEEYRDAGRPRLLNNHDELGLILFHFGPSMKYSELFLLFGCIPT